MSDITIIYLTANEMPDRWVTFQLGHLISASCNAPIISVSRQPMGLGTNILDTETKSVWNIYMQMLRASKMSTTPYIGIAEDDVLYTEEHFYSFRPPLDAVAYDRSRWSLFTWSDRYCLRQRLSNCALIAPREYLIDALEERKAKWPNGAPAEKCGEVGRSKVEHRLDVSVRNCVEWYSRGPIIHLNHPTGNDKGRYTVNGRRLIKKHGQIQAYDIPYWGKAKDIIEYYEHT